VNFRTVIRWVQKGYLTANRLPGIGDHRISVSELLRFLKGNEMPIPASFLAETTEHKSKVLIVDDDLSLARSIQRALKVAGYETKIAKSGFEAGFLLSSFRPEIMTLDIHMNGMNGIEVLNAMNEMVDVIRPKTVIISGDKTGLVSEALGLGAKAFLSKPFQRDELLKVVEELVQK
jgi:DNA-binding NtrC family response regulator